MKGIWEAKSRLQKGFRWRIGHGTSARLWVDPWVLGYRSLLDHSLGNVKLVPNIGVSSIIDTNTRGWTIDSLKPNYIP